MEDRPDFSGMSKSEMLKKRIERLERRMMEESLSPEQEQQTLDEIAKLEQQLKKGGSGTPGKKPSQKHSSDSNVQHSSRKERIEEDLLKSAQDKKEKGKKLDLFEARALFDKNKSQ
jgi:uncharacterized coiled-coil DUF342 family protein